jgi:WXXGXW repeat (2 copies)
VRKIFPAVLFAFALGIGAAQAADIVVKVAPPHAVVEHRDARPSPQHVWVGGYHRWDGNAYVWEKGRWEIPPHPGAKWVAPRWNHRKDGYVFVEGSWR